MRFFVIYKLGERKIAELFEDGVAAIRYAEKHNGKIYFEKEGVQYPDEKEKGPHAAATAIRSGCE